MNAVILQGTSLDKGCKAQKNSTSDRIRCLSFSLQTQEKGIYLGVSGVKLSAYAIGVLFPSASCAPGFYPADPPSYFVENTIWGRLPGSASYAGGLLEAYWSLLGGQLCRKANLNRKDMGKPCVKPGFSWGCFDQGFSAILNQLTRSRW